MRLTRLAALAALALLTPLSQAAATPPADLPGSADHPLIKRFNGSWLAGQRVSEWDAAAVPAAPEFQKADKYKFKDLIELEGKITRLLYVAPRGKSALEVWRNYEQALAAAAKEGASCIAVITLRVGELAGVEVEAFMAILRGSALYAPTFDKKLAKELADDYSNPNFPTAHLRKDLALFQGAAERAGLDSRGLEGLLTLLAGATAAGLDGLDYCALHELTAGRAAAAAPD